ncbi:MAG: PLP-dependent cysteine synthase family protein [Halobacteriales archaeon]|nr:PLP-dependent cysteine synthase family protein [Halobacteriales archaeon]
MYDSILDTIGSPLVQVGSPPGVTIAAKVESFNPGGSAKDRPALWMIEAAEASGDLQPGDTIVEPTSGNTGIGIAMVAAAKGYDAKIVMPASKSPERRSIMKAYGAEIELVEGEIAEAKDRADEIEATEDAVQLRQFENAANPQAHYETTGQEIIDALDDRTVDAFVASVGTGGTLTGTARRLLEEFPEMDVVAVEPEDNAVLSTGEAGQDDFQGMGAGFVSDILDTDIIDSVETVSIDAAEAECRRLAQEEGILVGQSSGAAMLASIRVGARLANPAADCPPAPTTVKPDIEGDTGKPVVSSDGGDRDGECPLVVTAFWDSGERYMSTGMFDSA